MIKVTDRFYINADTHSYSLQEKVTIQDENSKNFGKEVFRDVGYYASIESCLKGMFTLLTREYINSPAINDLKDLQDEIIKTRKFLENLNLNI